MTVLSEFPRWLRWLRYLSAMQVTRVHSLDQKDLLEKEMVSHSNILAWEIPWTEKPEGLQL